MIPCLLVVFTWHLEILVTTLSSLKASNEDDDVGDRGWYSGCFDDDDDYDGGGDNNNRL